MCFDSSFLSPSNALERLTSSSLSFSTSCSDLLASIWHFALLSWPFFSWSFIVYSISRIYMSLFLNSYTISSPLACRSSISSSYFWIAKTFCWTRSFWILTWCSALLLAPSLACLIWSLVKSITACWSRIWFRSDCSWAFRSRTSCSRLRIWELDASWWSESLDFSCSRELAETVSCSNYAASWVLDFSCYSFLAVKSLI